jgi:hypothetical protein
MQSGDVREVQVASELMSLGIPVSRPLSDNLKYDLVAEVDGSLLKVQVKTAKDRTDTDQHSIVSELHYRGEDGSKCGYDSSDVDVFVLVHRSTEEIFWLPFEDCADKSVSLSRVKEGHTQVKRLASEYLLTERFK